MLTTLNGMFLQPKPHRLNFIKENKKKLKEISSMVNQNSRFDVAKSKSSQTDVKRSLSRSSTGVRDRNSTSSACRLSTKGSMAVFVQERKDKGSISSISLTPKQKSSQRVVMQKNQSCQTIDPRRCDQLFHEGVIKYPSNKILQELAEIEKQKANRLDAHVRKEFFKRNKVKKRSPNRFALPRTTVKPSGKGDEPEEVVTTESEEEVEEVEKVEKIEKIKEPEPDIPVTVSKPKPNPPPTMKAAEIIRRTTEQYSPRGQSDHTPNSKGDAKQNKKFRKKSAREEEIMKTVLDPQCPPGHIPLPDAERKKTLHMLRVSHAELVREMNLLPVRTDTLRIRQKKIQLENQLNKIEEGIKVFNKSKVYVKVEE